MVLKMKFNGFSQITRLFTNNASGAKSWRPCCRSKITTIRDLSITSVYHQEGFWETPL